MRLIKPASGARIRPPALILLTVLLAVQVLMLNACGEPAAIITVGGSTTVQPLAEKLAAMYTKDNPKVSIVIQGGGSGAGITGVSKSEFDVGMSSRELTFEDPKLIKHILGKDAIAIITNKSNTLSNLSKDQVRNIFAGKITNWNELGGPAKSIHVISREAGSGTRTSFEDMVMNKNPITTNAASQNSNSAVKDAVSADELSIGYLSLGQLDKAVKELDVNGISCSTENAINGKYPIVRPLYFLTRSEPEGLVKKFIDYCQSSKGKTVIVEAGYISVQ
jgi:phosphate transport system substrate-binding protein